MDGIWLGVLFIALFIYGWYTGFSDGRDDGDRL